VISSLESIDWCGFLGRPPLPAPSAEDLDAIAREKILITGAGGSIGSELALRLAAVGPDLVLLDSSESSLFMLESALRTAPPRGSARLILGSVLDRNLVDEIFERYAPSVVFHAAAYKQVPLLEEHPLAAVETNAFGTYTLARMAARHNARIILLSTDKAVKPASVMGATKRVAEQIVLDAGGTVLRLGNVLATSGSVAEVFAAQITCGGPLTVTDPAACRYFLTIQEAVDLLIHAFGERSGASLLVPALRTQHSIAALARFMAHALAPEGEIALAFTSARPGDKTAENLLGPDERIDSVRTSGLQSVRSPGMDGRVLHRMLAQMRQALDARDLPVVMAALQALVPDFLPSMTLQSIVDQSAARVAP
jgi:FlaA1/EpsC-like NDP-sugar epimerase